MRRDEEMRQAVLVTRLDDVVEPSATLLGGKGASLAALARLDGVQVPRGFCVTTEAFALTMSMAGVREALERPSLLGTGDPEEAKAEAAELRRAVRTCALSEGLTAAILEAASALGDGPYAVRSSAAAEDSPMHSFAGLHDSYLNVDGPAALLDRIRRCWASLYTERAVAYRLHNGLGHDVVAMAVVVQLMLRPEISGVLFTAEPVSGNRKVLTVEAAPGLGDVLVAGRVDPDVFSVRGEEIVDRIRSDAGPDATSPSDAQVLELARLGRRLERHFGTPQDVEWCLVEGNAYVVQSRPITTLFPLPAAGDEGPHVYLSVGHQQMMTDPMRPLGISFWQLTSSAPMLSAGGRLFVDATSLLASPTNRDRVIEAFESSDPLTGAALRDIVRRGFVPLATEGEPAPRFLAPSDPIETDQAIVDALVAANERSVRALHEALASRQGPALTDAIRDDLPEMRRLLFDPRGRQVFMSAMEAARWLNSNLESWLGEKNVADVLTQSVPNNVTSAMGMDLLDVADAIRPYPAVIELLRRSGDDVLDVLAAVEGGRSALAAIEAYLDKYGMRCVGEIDITRPRWGERPSVLVPLILANIDNFEPGEHARRFEAGRRAAEAKEREVLDRLRALPDGEPMAEETKQMIDRVRTYIGYREYPKFGMVSRYFVYKQALLGEAGRLVDAGILQEVEDLYFLIFPEIEELVRTGEVDMALLRDRRREFASYQSLTPPRVLTSEGETVTGAYSRDDIPAGALPGVAVSAGTVEGRARVLDDLHGAALEPGDILVTAFTDPSWSPLFVTAAGLVTEVGGLMTHGAVIAREYGLPAVVAVERATQLIRDGQRVRVHGSGGYVELLP